MSEDAREQLLAYLGFLTVGAREGQCFDVRWGRPDLPMRKRLIPAAQPQHVCALALAHRVHCDVYIGPCLREDPRPGAASVVSAAQLLFIECDDPGAREALAGFACPPTLEIASGRPGHVHAYWRLAARLSAGQIRQVNLRLALALGADPACADPTRMLRPPGTLNHKDGAMAPVRLLASRPEARYELAPLVGALPPLSEDRRRTEPAKAFARRGEPSERALRDVPAERYVRLLTDREPDRQGKVLCPFHDETRPSLQLYPDATFYCFGCGRGGSIIDFASYLWGIAPRRAGFEEICDRLAARLL
jgi:hypothetical protein